MEGPPIQFQTEEDFPNILLPTPLSSCLPASYSHHGERKRPGLWLPAAACPCQIFSQSYYHTHRVGRRRMGTTNSPPPCPCRLLQEGGRPCARTEGGLPTPFPGRAGTSSLSPHLSPKCHVLYHRADSVCQAGRGRRSVREKDEACQRGMGCCEMGRPRQRQHASKAAPSPNTYLLPSDLCPMPP